MTAHTHTVVTPGCFRCDLGSDEAGMTPDKPQPVVTLDVAGPPGFVSSNGRGSWHVHNKALAAWRLCAANIGRRAHATQFGAPVEIVVLVHRQTNRHSDASNVFPTIKAVIDGICDAGILRDDSDTYVSGLTIRRGKNTAKPRLTVTLTR